MEAGRKSNARLVFAVCFLALMTTMGASAVFSCVKGFIDHKRFHAAIGADVPAVSSFRKKYPFTGADSENAADDSVNPKYRIPPYWKTVRYRTRLLELYAVSRNPLVNCLYRSIRALDEKIGSNMIENSSLSVIRLPNGYFTHVYTGGTSLESWEKVREWNLWLAERKIPLLQLLPATKSDDSIAAFPAGHLGNYTRKLDAYKAFLTENHIPYWDTKNVLLAENRDFYSWFYKTDHHWNVLAGRLVAEAAARKLNDQFQIATDADAVKAENFRLIRYPSCFKGSLTFIAGAPPEDIEVFYQRKESRFHLEIPSAGIDRVGGFNETLIAEPYLQSSSAYAVFLYGSKPLIQIENLACRNGTRILVIKESQGNVVCPYLACAVQYLDVIALALFDGSVKSFIEQTKPDAVLICI